VHGGAFPAWLAPVQVAILPVSDGVAKDAVRFADRCRELGLRADVRDEGTLAARIRAGKLVPYQVVIGPREAASDQVSLRLRDGRRLDAQSASQVLHRIDDLVRLRGTTLW